jgi:heavy metal translocating P-type ATPase
MPFVDRSIEVKSYVPGRLRLGLGRHLRPPPSALEDGPAHGACALAFNARTRSLLARWDESQPAEAALARVADVLQLEPPARAALHSGVAERASAGARARARSTLAREPWTIKSRLPGRVRLHHACFGSCASVHARVDAALVNLTGVIEHELNPITSTLLVRYDPAQLSHDELLDAIAELGDEALDAASAAGLLPSLPELDEALLRLVLSTGALGVSAGAIAAPLLSGVALASVALSAAGIFASAARSLFVDRKLRVDFLDSVVIGLAIWRRYLVGASVLIGSVTASHVLLRKSSRRSRRHLTDVFGQRARAAVRLREGAESECAASALVPGDVILVRATEQIPADGTIVDGAALIDQAALTGEHAPAERGPGDAVLAMTTVLSGDLQVRVTRAGADTNAARTVELLTRTLSYQVQLQSRTERFADAMVVPTLAAGLAGYAAQGSAAMMAIVNADYGTGIRIAGPLALLQSISFAVSQGILVKHGRALERLRDVDAVVLDKTGTLTEETPEVGRVVSHAPSIDARTLLAWAAAAEQRLHHPVARAVRRHASVHGVEVPQAEGAAYRVGFGVSLRVAGQAIDVGSRRHMESRSIGVDAAVEREVAAMHARGGSALFVAADGHLVGLLELTSAPREGAAQMVRWLRSARGIEEIHLLSGDHAAPTRALAARLGIGAYEAEVSPEDKASRIVRLQDRGHTVMMIGDGINDTAALRQADCSISLRGAADAAVDAADVVFMDGRLAKLDLLYRIADELHDNLVRSLALVVVPNSICIAGAFAGVFGLGASLVFNNVFNLVASANGMLAQRGLRRELARELKVRQTTC